MCAKSIPFRSDASTRCPCPVAAREISAVRMPWMASMPPRVSATGAPQSTGPPAGSPVIAMRPPRACARESRPGFSRQGPSGPKAEIEQ